MAVDNPNVVDIVATREGDDEVILVVADHLEWQDIEPHLRALQDKLNGYLGFVESGELVRKYPNAANKSVRIEVALKHTPPPQGERFLEQARGIVEGAGFHLTWRLAGV